MGVYIPKMGLGSSGKLMQYIPPKRHCHTHTDLRPARPAHTSADHSEFNGATCISANEMTRMRNAATVGLEEDLENTPTCL